MPSRLKALGERLLPPRKRQELAEQRRVAKEEATERRRRERIEQRRQALLASDSDVHTIKVNGRTFYGRGVSSFTAASASARNLTLVTEALSEAGVDYFLVPGRSRTRHVVGARFEDRKRVLTALRGKYGSSPLYATKPGSDPWPGEAVLYADGSLPATLKRQETIRFGEILLGPDSQVLADLSFGCDVEFWRNGAELLEDEQATERLDTLRSQAPPAVLKDALVAPRINVVTDTLPGPARVAATRVIGGQEHPTFEDFLQPRIDIVDFPVDVVYTWVDGSDPELAAKRARYRDGGTAPQIHARETGASRYTSHDELKYSLRSLEMYAPFVRNIYIVTDGQKPEWLNADAEGIRVVDHKEISPTPQPCRSSTPTRSVPNSTTYRGSPTATCTSTTTSSSDDRSPPSTSSTATASRSCPSRPSSSVWETRTRTSPHPTRRGRTSAASCSTPTAVSRSTSSSTLRTRSFARS